MRLNSCMYTFEIQQVIMSLSVPSAKESINALISPIAQPWELRLIACMVISGRYMRCICRSRRKTSLDQDFYTYLYICCVAARL